MTVFILFLNWPHTELPVAKLALLHFTYLLKARLNIVLAFYFIWYSNFKPEVSMKQFCCFALTRFKICNKFSVHHKKINAVSPKDSENCCTCHVQQLGCTFALKHISDRPCCFCKLTHNLLNLSWLSDCQVETILSWCLRQVFSWCAFCISLIIWLFIFPNYSA